MNKEIEEMRKDLIEIFYEECEKRGLITPQNTAEKMTDKGYRKQKVAHWFIVEYEWFTCSECAHDVPSNAYSTKGANELLENGCTPKYCPNCGAKMKGGEE